MLATGSCGNGVPVMASGPIVTAHTLDDQAETVIMRLARGSGVEGLGAMPAESREPWHVLRPFLTVPRARLLATLEARGLPFIDDPSNHNRAFERVRTREVLATRRGRAERQPHCACRSTAAPRQPGARAPCARGRHALLAVAPEGSGSLDRNRLMELPTEIRIRLLGRAIARFGGHPEAPRLASLEAMERWIAGSEGTSDPCGMPTRPAEGQASARP